MATLIEEQIHRAFIALEEERCMAIEAKTGEPVKRREVPKPWTRLGPHAILQDSAFLQYVTELDYDLRRAAFRKYCRARGVLYVAGTPGSPRWSFYRDHEKTQQQFVAEPFFRFAEPHEGVAHEFSSEDLLQQWRIVCLGRATLQDCWELFQQTAAPSAGRPGGGRRRKRPQPSQQKATPQRNAKKRPTSSKTASGKPAGRASQGRRSPRTASTKANARPPRTKQLRLFDETPVAARGASRAGRRKTRKR